MSIYLVTVGSICLAASLAVLLWAFPKLPQREQ
jgi:hypothetical protein